MIKKLTQEEFERRVTYITNGTIDISQFVYVNSHTKGKCTCKVCGHEWDVVPHSLLKGIGCPACGRKRNIKAQAITTDEFIRRAKEVHGDRYDYSKVEYVNAHKKVEIICPTHGSFFQIPSDHVRGFGCQLCGCEKTGKRKRKTKEEFVAEYYRRYPLSRYDLSSIEYKTTRTPITLVCKEHGPFQIQPQYLLRGCGCQQCSMSSLEKNIMKFLDDNHIKYDRIKRAKWLGLQTLDFYLPEYNVAIECQGNQHFRAIAHFGGKEKLDLIVERDERKKRLCKENSVKLIYFLEEPNVKYMKEEDTYFTDIENLSNILQNMRSERRKPRRSVSVHPV